MPSWACELRGPVVNRYIETEKSFLDPTIEQRLRDVAVNDPSRKVRRYSERALLEHGGV